MNLFLACLAYVVFAACVVALMRDSKARHRAERDTDRRTR